MSRFSKWQAIAALLLSVSLTPARAEIPASERAVLEALYISTDGDNWTDNTGWNGPAVCPGAVIPGNPNATASPWTGVFCGVIGSADHVVSINLADNNLTGPLPALANLTELRRFFAYSTNGDGSSNVTSLPPDLASLTKLERFSVAGNGPGLTGTIPSLSALTNLAQFRVNHNGLTGSLPSLAGLSNLQIFWAQSNSLTGQIPPLSGLTALTDFEVDRNQLTGSIPPLSGLTNLEVFTVYTNRLTGVLPSLNGLGSLRAFSAADNQLTGSIPSLVGQGLGALRRFRVHRNQLTGPIPDITGLSLESFAVGFNRLTGPVPTAPATLLAGESNLCPNNLSKPYADSPAWDAATGSTPWWSACDVAVAPVPTLSQWTLMVLGLLMAGMVALRRGMRA
ncbi:MAG: IPTL-CTERM sorting domain-containing protein [Burkholderiaceae bacterium]